jgi:DNA uptake protein ComE-like DNA-binding protein
MKQYLKDFFNYSRTEQRGIVLLVILIVASETLRMNWFRIIPQKPHAQFKITELSKQWMETQKSKEDSVFQRRFSDRNQHTIPVLLQPFDPNSLDSKGWQAMGFSQKESESILKYTSKGGRFRKKEDLKKLYCMNNKRYEALSPYVRIDSLPTKSKSTNSFAQFKTIEINQADSIELLQIKGIGKFRASQIIRRRNQLGGFWHSKQLLEIKNFPDSLYLQILPWIKIDSSSIRKININKIEFEELQKHPYFWYGVAKSIVNYRNKHGPFRQPSDLQAIYAIKPEQLEKVVHYITFE